MMLLWFYFNKLSNRIIRKNSHWRPEPVYEARLYIAPDKRADAHSDQSLRWALMQSCRKCRAPAQFVSVSTFDVKHSIKYLSFLNRY